MNRFKWEGLPDTVDVRFMEMMLFYYGLAVFYHDKELDVDLVVQGAGTAYVNMLQNPVAFNVIGPGPGFTPDSQTMRTKTLSAYNPAIDYEKIGEDPKEKCFPIWANYVRTPDLDVVAIYARRFAMFDRTIEINAMQARKPKVLRANQDNQLTLNNIARQQDQGAEIIVVNGASVSMDEVEVLDLGIDPNQLSELHLTKTRLWNECMGILGIDNSNQDKKERLVSSEVDANNDQTSSFRSVQLNARRQAAEQINKVFGCNVEVNFNVEVEAEAKALAAQQGMEDQNDKPEKSNDNG
jgi:hypothetical protein